MCTIIYTTTYIDFSMYQYVYSHESSPRISCAISGLMCMCARTHGCVSHRYIWHTQEHILVFMCMYTSWRDDCCKCTYVQVCVVCVPCILICVAYVCYMYKCVHLHQLSRLEHHMCCIRIHTHLHQYMYH